MKILLLLFAMLLPAAAMAQSTPNYVDLSPPAAGALTAAQLIALATSKQDYNGDISGQHVTINGVKQTIAAILAAKIGAGADISSSLVTLSGATPQTLAAILNSLNTRLGAIGTGSTVITGSTTLPSNYDISGLPVALNGGNALSVANRFARHRSIDDFAGIHGDCETDDTLVFVAAMAQVAADGGGELEVGPRCYALTSAVLTVPSKVKLVGHWWPGSQSYANYSTTPYTLALGAAYGLSMQSNTAIEGLILVRSGMITPVDVRSSENLIRSFAGTAITVPGGTLDVDVRNMAIFGFNRAINTIEPFERLNVNTVLIDCTNGIKINGSHDISRIENVHAWPFLTANFAWVSQSVVAISSVSNLNGLVQIVTATPHGFLTGDKINTHDVLGVPAADTYGAITVQDATHFTFDGSVFAGAFTASPSASAALDLYRRDGGVAFEVFNSEMTVISNSFAYDYDVAYHAGANSGWTQFLNDSADSAYQLKDPFTTAVVVDGTAYGNSFVGGTYISHSTEFLLNSSAATGTIVSGATIDPGSSANPYVIRAVLGRATFSGNQSYSGIAAQIQVADNIDSLILNGNDFISWQVFGSPIGVSKTQGFGNQFAAGTPGIGNIVASNVTVGQLVHEVISTGSAGTDASSAEVVSGQRVYVFNTPVGAGITLNGMSVGADSIIWNGGANPLKIYISNGIGFINSLPNYTLASNTSVRLSQINLNLWLTY